MTVAEALADAGIQLRRYDIGRTHRGPCPRCDHGPRDNALAVTIHNETDVVWICHRCGWAGGWRRKELWERRQPEPTLGGKSFPTKGGSNPQPKGFAAGPQHKKSFPTRPNIAEQIAGRKLQRITPDNLAGRYFEGRSCALPTNDVIWTPAEWHPQERRHFPCIVSKITNIVTAEAQSLHFTYLDPDGDGKAKIDRPRLYLAGYPKAGGVVRLHADAEVEQGVIIGEGIETCLSYALEFSPVWSCLDSGNLSAFPVLPGLQGLTILVDNDDAGRDAFEVVRERYEAASIEVIGIRAGGKPGADINDLVAT